MQVVQAYKSDDGHIYPTEHQAKRADIIHWLVKLTGDRDGDRMPNQEVANRLINVGNADCTSRTQALHKLAEILS